MTRRRPYGDRLADELLSFLEGWPEQVREMSHIRSYVGDVLRIEELEGWSDEDLDEAEGLINMGELDDLYADLPRMHERAVASLRAYADKLRVRATRLPGP